MGKWVIVNKHFDWFAQDERLYTESIEKAFRYGSRKEAEDSIRRNKAKGLEISVKIGD